MSTEFTALQTAMMQRALHLAVCAGNTTSPNPKVGCVIAHGEQIVGEGFHVQAGAPHAEVHALRQAGDLARGATAYVTLEPCSHTGKTPPCANALIEAGVAEVICAMVDPNPQVAGQGLARLQAASIHTAHGLLREQAQAINRGFLSRIQRSRPFVTLKLAASLDGKTALADGTSQWITGSAARNDVHQERASRNAIITGSGTVLADNPQLNVRGVTCLKPPVRVVLDRSLRSPATAQIFDTTVAPTWLFTAAEHNTSAYAARGVHCFVWPEAYASKSLTFVLNALAEAGINEAWVEAGAQLSAAFIQQNCVDELVLYQAPKILGEHAIGLLPLQADASVLAQESVWKTVSVQAIGNDIKWRLRHALHVGIHGEILV